MYAGWVLFPFHIHLIYVVGSITLQKGVIGINAFIGLLGSLSVKSILAVLER